VREVYEAYHSFRRLLAAEADVVMPGADGLKKKEWAENFRDHVDVEELYLTGHSFGGGTMVRTELGLGFAHPSQRIHVLPERRDLSRR
jgi:platelet-activating factor acetylhydrolase